MNLIYTDRNSAHHRQKGMVLIIALLVLVAMTLASIGLMRSVDTSTLAISNMSLRQAADEAALAAVLAEIRRIETVILNQSGGAVTLFENNGAGALALGHYYAFIQANENAKGIPLLLQNMSNTGVRVVGPDTFGHTERVMIERLCRAIGPCTDANCLSIAANVSAIPGIWGLNESDLDFLLANPMPLFRITARVDGPRNVVSYAQSIVSFN
jgi:Tfp pilus assembly protein PilX